MRTAVIHHANPATAVAKGNQALAQQHQPNRITIGFEFSRLSRWNPVLAHEVTHDRAGPYAREVYAVLELRHG
jgi:hypothetical protein